MLSNRYDRGSNYDRKVKFLTFPRVIIFRVNKFGHNRLCGRACHNLKPKFRFRRAVWTLVIMRYQIENTDFCNLVYFWSRCHKFLKKKMGVSAYKEASKNLFLRLTHNFRGTYWDNFDVSKKCWKITNLILWWQ